MWSADDDEIEVHTNSSHSSKPNSGFSLDDAFSEDENDGTLDASLEFNSATIRAALARSLAAGGLETAESQNGTEGDGRGTDTGALDSNPAHDRSRSVVEDPDASVSTLDINASPAHVPGRAPGEWSRSTSHSYGYGYRQDSHDSPSGVESLENFSRISLSDSVHDLQSVEISLEEGTGQEEEEEGDAEEGDDVLFHAVHIDLSQGGKPRVEEVAAVLPEPSDSRASGRDEARTPSPKHPQPPALPPTPNGDNDTYTPSSMSTPTSKVLRNHQSQGQSHSVPSSTTYRRSNEDSYARDEPNHTPSDSGRTVLSASSLVPASSKSVPGSIPTSNSMGTPLDPPRTESFRRGHRPSKSVGPSALDKVISKTRPTFLPPKPKVEDLRHMADWEIMMKQSRAVGEFPFDSVVWFSCSFFVFWEDSSVLTFSPPLSNYGFLATLPSWVAIV